MAVEDMQKLDISRVGPETISKLSTEYIKIILDSRDSQFRDAALSNITQLCYFKVIKADLIEQHEALLDKLKTLGKSGNEKAVIALGAISLIFPVVVTAGESEVEIGESRVTKIKDVLFSIHDNKMPELSFATGEALSVLAVGWDSQILARKMDITGGIVLGTGLEDRANGVLLTSILSEVLDMRVKGGSVSYRKVQFRPSYLNFKTVLVF